jgi:hypothetical protein
VTLPPAPALTEEGFVLIIEAETGGQRQYERSPHPEYIGDRFSGVTWGIGYDAHQNSAAVIRLDWSGLGEGTAGRLAATQPYYGRAAHDAWLKVRDIPIGWGIAVEVFQRVDLARVDLQCRRAFPGFENLSSLAKDAIRSLVFNRGASMTGPARVEMRAIRDLVPNKDYRGMAVQERKMKRLWRGTKIERGMNARREAEARLFESAAKN